MCGRATLTQTPQAIEKHFQLTFSLELKEQLNERLPNYNIAPTNWHPVITNQGNEQLQLFKWGLIPSWAKDAKIGSRLINARIETITEKPAFRAVFKRRCLVPFDGFYEWKRVGKTKTPYRIVVNNQSIFTVAGIWEQWKNEQGDWIPTFSVLTQSPNELMKNIHNRMPVILSKEEEKLWLDPDLPLKELLSHLQPYPAELMEAYPVSKNVGNVRNNDASLIEREI